MRRKPNIFEAIAKCKKHGIKIKHDKKNKKIKYFDEWKSYGSFVTSVRDYFRKRYASSLKEDDRRKERARTKHLLAQEKFDLLTKKVYKADPWDYD